MADATAGLPFSGGQLGYTKQADGTYAVNMALVGGAANASGAVVTRVPAATGDTLLLTVNPNRRGCPSVYYDGAAAMYVLAGDGVPGPNNFSVVLGQGKATYWSPECTSYTGQLRAAWSSAAGAAQVTEFI